MSAHPPSNTHHPSDNPLSRRHFLKTGLLGSAALLALHRWSPAALNPLRHFDACPHCAISREQILRALSTRTLPRHCPNCAADLHTGQWQLPQQSHSTEAHDAHPSWSQTKVPFPRTEIAPLTDKPCFHAAQLRHLQPRTT